MNQMTAPFRKVASVAASAAIMATSLTMFVSPAVAPVALRAAGDCVQEQGSTTVFPALVKAQPDYQGAVSASYPTWPSANALGCTVSLTANGSGTGKNRLRLYITTPGAGGTRMDLAASSAPLSSSNDTQDFGGATSNEAADLYSFQVGGDAMVMATRDDNTATSISMKEVTEIYMGSITDWSGLANANGQSGRIDFRARIQGSGTRDDMNRLFKMDRGCVSSDTVVAVPNSVNCPGGGKTLKSGHTSSTSPCGQDFTTTENTNYCEPYVVDHLGLPRLTTSQEEADAICTDQNALVYTSLANLQTFGVNNGCGNGHSLKALPLQACTYTGYDGTPSTLSSISCSGSPVTPSTTTAAASGNYPAKRVLLLTLPKVSLLAAKYGAGNPGWVDDLGVNKAIALINFMESTQGQTSVTGVGFIGITVPAKQPIPDADVDMNGGIGLTDIGVITGRWNQTNTTAGWSRGDLDHNGGIGLSDIGKITGQWGATGFTGGN